MTVPTSISATRIHFSLKGIAVLFVAILLLAVLWLAATRVVIPWIERKVPGAAKVTGGAGSSQGSASRHPALAGLS